MEVIIISEYTHRGTVLNNVLQNSCCIAIVNGRRIHWYCVYVCVCVCVCVWRRG